MEASGWREWPPRLPGQPIFYPVLSEEYTAKIARGWNVPRCGAGYVTGFQVLRSLPARLERQHCRHNRGDCGVPLIALRADEGKMRTHGPLGAGTVARGHVSSLLKTGA